jgi:hypothetical protein
MSCAPGRHELRRGPELGLNNAVIPGARRQGYGEKLHGTLDYANIG